MQPTPQQKAALSRALDDAKARNDERMKQPKPKTFVGVRRWIDGPHKGTKTTEKKP